jgi:hypothetical protein
MYDVKNSDKTHTNVWEWKLAAVKEGWKSFANLRKKNFKKDLWPS